VHSTPTINSSKTDDIKSAISAPGSPHGALFPDRHTPPERIFQAIGRLRKEAREEIDPLIGFLDKPTITCRGS
jgi:hypothetical protein